MMQATPDDSVALFFAVAISGEKSGHAPSVIGLIVQRAHPLTGQWGGAAGNVRQHAAPD